MTTKLEQAARQALGALVRSNHGFEENPDKWPCTIEDNEEAITALREALAEQAEQEPVAWGQIDQVGTIVRCVPYATTQYDKYKSMGFVVQLYAAPVRTKDLTDDEISDAIHGEGSPLRLHDYAIRDFRAVIAADREKNK